MTVSSTSNSIAYVGNGSTTAFAFPYPVQDESHIKVVETVIATGAQSNKALTTDFTVAIASGGASATITAVTAPASTVRWTILRDPSPIQSTDFVDNDSLPAATLENAFDKLTMISQRTRELTNRSLRQPDGDTDAIDTLPAKVARASMYLAFDADGDPIASPAPEGGNVVSAFMTTVLDDTDAATARTTLGAGAGTVTSVSAGAGLSGGPVTGAGSLSLDTSIFRGYIAGLVPTNNAADGDHDLDFTAGVAWALDGSAFVEVAALTKQFDAAFAAGTDAGALGDTVSLPTSGTLHIFAIKNDSTGAGDILADTDAGGANVPTGWTVIRRIVSITTDASANLIAFSARELAGGALKVLVKDPPLDVSAANPGTSAVLRALTVPGGIKVTALLNFSFENTGIAVSSCYFSSPDANDEAASRNTNALNQTGGIRVGSNANIHGGGQLEIDTNTSSQIRTRLEASDATTALYIATVGWIDDRRS